MCRDADILGPTGSIFPCFFFLCAGSQIRFGRHFKSPVWSMFSFRVVLISYARMRSRIKHVLIRCVWSASRGFNTSMKLAVSSLLRRHKIGPRARMQPYLVWMGRPYTCSADDRMPEARDKLAVLGRIVNSATEVSLIIITLLYWFRQASSVVTLSLAIGSSLAF